jgi:3-oxo-5-alpha-steroid 4-dehydrogenase 3
VWAIPVFRLRFLEYGARASSEEPAKREASDQVSKKSHEADNGSSLVSLFVKILDVAAKIQVPHSWFTSFYVVSVLSSLFWLVEAFRVGDFYGIIIENRIAHQRSQMSLPQTKLAWLLMLIQGSRRLYESLTLPSSSTSKMWIGHWMIGIGFYLATGVAIWVEGAGKSSTYYITLSSQSFSVSCVYVTDPLHTQQRRS